MTTTDLKWSMMQILYAAQALSLTIQNYPKEDYKTRRMMIEIADKTLDDLMKISKVNE